MTPAASGRSIMAFDWCAMGPPHLPGFTSTKSSSLLNPLFPLGVASLRGWPASESPGGFRHSAFAMNLPADPNIMG